jgi:hypothetical protein
MSEEEKKKIIDYAVLENTGFIADEPLETDLYFGANDRVDHNIAVLDMNWLPYYSRGELQHGVYYDTMSCVTFSALNILEAVLNYQIAHGMVSAENVQWLQEKEYFDEDGKLNLSDRFTAAMSNTTERGNTGGAVWWSIRNHGVVPEHMWTWDKGRDVPYDERFGDWFRDKSLIPEDVKAIGKEFKERFEVFYERTATTEAALKKALVHSPVHIFIPTSCPYDANRIQQYCDGSIGHAVSMCDDLEPRNYYPLFDHYLKNPQEEGQEQYIRRVVENYKFYPTGYVCTVTQKNAPNEEDMPNTFVKFLKDKNSAAVGILLPFTSPQTLENMALHYNKPVPKKADGGIDWDKLIEGEYELEAATSGEEPQAEAPAEETPAEETPKEELQQ